MPDNSHFGQALMQVAVAPARVAHLVRQGSSDRLRRIEFSDAPQPHRGSGAFVQMAMAHTDVPVDIRICSFITSPPVGPIGVFDCVG